MYRPDCTKQSYNLEECRKGLRLQEMVYRALGGTSTQINSLNYSSWRNAGHLRAPAIASNPVTPMASKPAKSTASVRYDALNIRK